MVLRSAKSKVNDIRQALLCVYPEANADELHEAALDLHDIEQAARHIASQIHSLYVGTLAKAEIKDRLDTIEAELFTHLIPNHAESLKRFFAKTSGSV